MSNIAEEDFTSRVSITMHKTPVYSGKKKTANIKQELQKGLEQLTLSEKYSPKMSLTKVLSFAAALGSSNKSIKESSVARERSKGSGQVPQKSLMAHLKGSVSYDHDPYQ